LKEVAAFPEAIDVFARTVSSRNTSSGRRVFVSSSKLEVVPEVWRYSWNTGDINRDGQHVKLQ
jgi:hypothetical protein